MKTETRRKLLKGIAISAPIVWIKPVVHSVVLPAHAEMSNVSATVQLFTDGFGMEITGNPPEVTIGTTFNFLITTNSPNTTFYYTTYAEDGTRNDAPESFITDGDGRAALSATPPGPAGINTFVIALTAAALVQLLALAVLLIVTAPFRKIN